MSRYDKYNKYCKSFLDFSKIIPFSSHTQEEKEATARAMDEECERNKHIAEHDKQMIRDGIVPGKIYENGTYFIGVEHDTTIEDMLKGRNPNT